LLVCSIDHFRWEGRIHHTWETNGTHT